MKTPDTRSNVMRMAWMPALTASLYALAVHAHAMARLLVQSHWLQDLGVPLRDFDHLYVAARLLVNDRVNVYRLTYEAFQQAALRMGVPDASAWTNYAMSTFVAFWPLAQLPYPVARALWVLLTEVALLVIMCLPLWLTPTRTPWRWLAMSPFLVLSFFPLESAMVLGQPTILMTALLGLSALSFKRRRPWLGGLLLALAVVWKVQLQLLWVYLLARRQWKPACMGLGLTGLLELCGVQRLGFVAYGDWGRAVREQLRLLHGLGWENFALQEVLARSLRVSPLHPVLCGGFAVLGVLLVTWLWRWCHRSRLPFALEYPYGLSLFLILAFVITPRVSLVHMPLLLLPLLLVWNHALDQPRVFGGFLACYLILAVRFSLVQFPALTMGPWAIVTSVKTYAIVLLGWMVWVLRRQLRIPVASQGDV